MSFGDGDFNSFICVLFEALSKKSSQRNRSLVFLKINRYLKANIFQGYSSGGEDANVILSFVVGWNIDSS